MKNFVLEEEKCSLHANKGYHYRLKQTTLYFKYY